MVRFIFSEIALSSTLLATLCRIHDVAPHTWVSSSTGYNTYKFPVPFYAQPMSWEKVERGEEPPVRIRCAD